MFKSGNYDVMHTEMKCLGVKDDIAVQRIKQFRQIQKLNTSVKGAREILKFTKQYELTGNFKPLQLIVQVSVVYEFWRTCDMHMVSFAFVITFCPPSICASICASLNTCINNISSLTTWHQNQEEMFIASSLTKIVKQNLGLFWENGLGRARTTLLVVDCFRQQLQWTIG